MSLAAGQLGKGLGGGLTGLSVIKGGEAFRMSSVAEMKINLSPEEKQWSRSSNGVGGAGCVEQEKHWSKPVQAVRPMQKAPKPSATVKPFVKEEGISGLEEKEKQEIPPSLLVESNGTKSPDLASTNTNTSNDNTSTNGDTSEGRICNREVSNTQDISVPTANVAAPEITPVDPKKEVPSEPTTNGVKAEARETDLKPPTSPRRPTAKVAPEQLPGVTR